MDTPEPCQLVQKAGPFLEQALQDATHLDICTGYITLEGLRQMVAWLDPLPAEARVRLLVGMKVQSWEYEKPSPYSARNYLLQLLQQNDRMDAGKAEHTLQRLDQRAQGRLAVKVRLGQTKEEHRQLRMHAKYYRWARMDDAGGALVGSANLTGPGLGSSGELNLSVQGRETLADMDAWFETQWRASASSFVPLADGQNPPDWIEHPRSTSVAQPMWRKAAQGLWHAINLFMPGIVLMLSLGVALLLSQLGLAGLLNLVVQFVYDQTGINILLPS